MVKNNDNKVIDISSQFISYDCMDNRIELINILESVIKSTTFFSILEKRKLLKEIPNLKKCDVDKFQRILSSIDINNHLFLNSYDVFLQGKDTDGDEVKIRFLDLRSFLLQLGNYRSLKTEEPVVKDEMDIFVEKVLKIIKQNRNVHGDYYDCFESRIEISDVIGCKFDDLKIINRTMIDLYVESRLNAQNKYLDQELPFLSFDVLLNKYNYAVLEQAKKVPDSDKFLENYGVDSIIKEGNEKIKEKLINDNLFMCMEKYNENNPTYSFAYNLDFDRATEFMSIIEIVDIVRNNIDKYNNFTKIIEKMAQEGDKYGTRIAELEQRKKNFEKFKQSRLPKIVYVLKKRLIKEGIIKKTMDSRILDEKICSELFHIENVFGDYSKISDFGLEDLILKNDYTNKKHKFEELSYFGIIKVKGKQKQLGMPDYAKLF